VHAQPPAPVVVSAREYLGADAPAEPEPAVVPVAAVEPVQWIEPEPVAAEPVVEVQQVMAVKAMPVAEVVAEAAPDSTPQAAVPSTNIVSRFDQPDADGLSTY